MLEVGDSPGNCKSYASELSEPKSMAYEAFGAFWRCKRGSTSPKTLHVPHSNNNSRALLDIDRII